MKEPKKLTVAQLHRAWELGATHYHVFGRHAELLKKDGSDGWLGHLVNRDGVDGKADEQWEPVTTGDVDDPQPVPSLEDHHVEMMGEIKALMIEKYGVGIFDLARLMEVLRHELARIRHQETELASVVKHSTGGNV